MLYLKAFIQHLEVLTPRIVGLIVWIYHKQSDGKLASFMVYRYVGFRHVSLCSLNADMQPFANL